MFLFCFLGELTVAWRNFFSRNLVFLIFPFEESTCACDPHHHSPFIFKLARNCGSKVFLGHWEKGSGPSTCFVNIFTCLFCFSPLYQSSFFLQVGFPKSCENGVRQQHRSLLNNGNSHTPNTTINFFNLCVISRWWVVFWCTGFQIPHYPKSWIAKKFHFVLESPTWNGNPFSPSPNEPALRSFMV